MTTSPRLLARFSNLFVRKDEATSSASSDDDDEEMRDSMFSSLSSVHGNPNTTPPLRTVQVDPSLGEKNKQQVDEAFDQLMKEYALSSTIRPSLTQLTTAQKSMMLMQSSKKLEKTATSSSTRSNSLATAKSSNILSFKPKTYSRKSVRDVFTDDPEYFCRALRNGVSENDLVHLRIHLRSSVVSWTNQFLAQGGYEALTQALEQCKQDIKRQNNKQIELLCRCFKTIMIHENTGIEKVLTQPQALEHVRDILFGPADAKLKALYQLDVQTRQQLLGVLCTLPSIQVTTQDGTYIHGYDLLRQLLRDKPDDVVEESKKNSFHMSLKTDNDTMMLRISNNETSRPRYTAWMREIQLTVDRHIEPMTYLAQVLDYNFESAYRQLKVNRQQQERSDGLPPQDHEQPVVMVDEGVVDYLITNLRLICTLVTTPGTAFSGTYDKYEEEKMRMEIMLSGFKKITHALSACPHPTLYASYIRYLQPLLHPWADLFDITMDDNDDSWEDCI